MHCVIFIKVPYINSITYTKYYYTTDSKEKRIFHATALIRKSF